MFVPVFVVMTAVIVTAVIVTAVVCRFRRAAAGWFDAVVMPGQVLDADGDRDAQEECEG